LGEIGDDFMKETLLTAPTPEKVTLYSDFIRIFDETLESTKSKREVKNLGSKMRRIGLHMMILAPDSVAKAYIFWLALSASNNDPERSIDALGDLIMEMRKDLVGETACSRDDAIGIFLRDQI